MQHLPPAPLRPPRPLWPSRSLMLLPFHTGGPENISGNIGGESDESLSVTTQQRKGETSSFRLQDEQPGEAATSCSQQVPARGCTMAPVSR